MVTGEKNREYRKPSEWILSRLVDKNGNKKLTHIKFVNGYGKDKPYFICKFEGWNNSVGGFYEYSNGLKIDIQPADIVIYLGEIIETGNLK